MLFFKEIMENKLNNTAFRLVYEKECHICSTTLTVIASFEESGHLLPDILNRLGISSQAWRDLKEAEYCNPGIVRKLCNHLGLEDEGLFKNCPRL